MKVFTKNPFLIADISLEFYDFAKKEQISNMESAKILIDEAKYCGIDAVMFQAYKTENILTHDENAFEGLNTDYESYFISLKKYDAFGVEEYYQLSEYCHELGMFFLVNPLDFESADYLEDFIDIYKISSSDITNIPFIKHVARKNKPIMLTTGGSTLIEVQNAVKAIEDVSTADIVIMHSVLSHPTFYEDANLLMIKDLAQNFPDYEIGYSDHTQSDEDMMVLTTAYSFGASVLEKHFTFDKKFKSENYCYSMDPDDVIKFKKNVLFLSNIGGRKNKQPLICESSIRKEYRKSIVAKVDIKKGSIIKESDIAFKRPGVGIPPFRADDVIGKEAIENISKDSLIYFENLK